MAAELKLRGFHRIRPLAGGFQAWVSAGFEVLAPVEGPDRPRGDAGTSAETARG